MDKHETEMREVVSYVNNADSHAEKVLIYLTEILAELKFIRHNLDEVNE